jgi:indolepyruvate ferredoxin oxidoreductase
VVARLLIDYWGRVAAAALAEYGGTIRYHLHPPVLRALGYRRKIAIGAWTDPVWRALARGKRLRGTRFDPFGRTAMRRLERDLVTEYEATVDEVLDGLSTDRLPIAVALCELPDQVRGFEDLKVQRADAMRQLRDRLLEEYRSRPGPSL